MFFSIIGSHLREPLFRLKKKIFKRKPSCTDLIVMNLGGIPIEKRCTLTPTDLAAMKCPYSWMVIKTPNSIMNAHIVVIYN